MLYRNIIFIIIFIFQSNCSTDNLLKNKSSTNLINGYTNKGFALVYNDYLYKQKIISKKIYN